MLNLAPVVKVISSVSAMISLVVMFVFGMLEPLTGLSGGMLYICTFGLMSGSVCYFIEN